MTSDPDQEFVKQKITSHPGSGKTKTIIPELITQNRAKLKRKKILVTGPTRVVCRELHRSLVKEIGRVGLNVKGSNDRDDYADVQIAAHRTALRMLVNRDRAVRNFGVMIII